jgi:hypothetical protein
VAGILVGAVLAVGFAKLFMAAYPILLKDQTVMKAGEQPSEWSAAMTYKFVGVLRSLTDDKPYQRTAIWIGVAVGFGIELVRKLMRASAGYRRFVAGSRTGKVTDFVLDSAVVASPYALSFGGFVNLHTSLWFGAGGVISSLFDSWSEKRRTRPNAPADAVELPSDMSASSLFGGGLIAGDALAALGLGIFGLLVTLAG